MWTIWRASLLIIQLFSLSGDLNNQKHRIWGTKRPQINEVLQVAESIMVWCAISKKDDIAHFFF